MKNTKTKSKKEKCLIGWNEWCALPELGIKRIKAKIDTGAKTSALHAFDIKSYRRAGNQYVCFKVHPLQFDNQTILICHGKVVDQRFITSSNGHKERRFIIETQLHLNGQYWNIELSLSNRDPMMFRCLLGRQALKGRVVIDPSRALILGKNHTSKT